MQKVTADTKQAQNIGPGDGANSVSSEQTAEKNDYLWLGMSTKRIRRIQWFRQLQDNLARGLIRIGGVGVIAAVALIFFYLLIQILPLFKGASLSQPAYFSVQQDQRAMSNTGAVQLGSGVGDIDLSKASFFSVEEQFEVAMALFAESDADGSRARVDFMHLDVDFSSADEVDDDSVRVGLSIDLPIDPQKPIAAFVKNTNRAEMRLNGVIQGSTILLFKDIYEKSFSETKLGQVQSEIVPTIEFPYGASPYPVVPDTEIVSKVGMVHTSSALVVVSYTQTGKLFVKRWSIEQDLFGETGQLEEAGLEQLPSPRIPPTRILLEPALQWLYLAEGQHIEIYNLIQSQSHQLVDLGHSISSIEFLLGDISLLIGDAQGHIDQWFMVRNDDAGEADLGYALQKVRTFKLGDTPIVKIQPEQRRKSFLVVDEAGKLGVFYSTAHRTLFAEAWFEKTPNHVAVSPRGNYLLYDSPKGLAAVKVDNQHPEVSLASLWQEVWYENYIEPEYIWQSSAANNDFEPKFSLTPLAFGTLKAAMYAMIVAVPLAVCAAIYTAYFMAPALRRKVKPTIEFMEALPTVILGFLAGLWLAPFVEQNLPGIFAMLVILPLSFFLFGFAWSSLPNQIKSQVPDGWHPLLLVPVVICVTLFSMQISYPLEQAFFDGSIRNWLTNEMGVGFDQRNALVVGIAMGFAVIPTIYSITEDAIFAVPKNLSFGSLALGATPWQTLVRVILPTASPGIFSALMIGFGRAVGETMIVLMATGNTPIMDFNIFEGLRTLSANIAVEMPEAEVKSTHYRLLFLAAFVLFVITFCFNTSAEVVRQRLREKYGSL